MKTWGANCNLVLPGSRRRRVLWSSTGRYINWRHCAERFQFNWCQLSVRSGRTKWGCTRWQWRRWRRARGCPRRRSSPPSLWWSSCTRLCHCVRHVRWSCGSHCYCALGRGHVGQFPAGRQAGAAWRCDGGAAVSLRRIWPEEAAPDGHQGSDLRRLPWKVS